MSRARGKLIALVVLGALMVTFVLQNLDVAGIRFLFWSVEMSRALLVLIVFVIGAFAGWLLSALARKPHDPGS